MTSRTAKEFATKLTEEGFSATSANNEGLFDKKIWTPKPAPEGSVVIVNALIQGGKCVEDIAAECLGEYSLHEKIYPTVFEETRTIFVIG